MPVAIDEISKNAMGGTEQMKYGLSKRLDAELLDKFQIICSRVRDIDPKLIPIYWLHDLPGDPESEHLKQGGYNKFDKLVFVSNWQMQAYINYYGIPWHKCVVIQNAIEPIPFAQKSADKIKIIYHTTPHRGLGLLVPAFITLAEKYDNIELDVFSSFKIYGWEERDKPYEQLFQACKDHPKINYHGFQPNDVVRKALQEAHIFAYPSVWLETSCIALIEAMSAGCLCIHPNYGALYETAANFNWMYQFNQDSRDHSTMLYSMLDAGINAVHTEHVQKSLLTAKNYTDTFYNWNRRTEEWSNFLKFILATKRRG
jgi:UDP-glucose:(glucosyl)LPS alpha-1,2-glucosyltransferase